MRIELPKNKQVDKHESRVNKNENSVFDSSNQLKSFDSPPPPTTGAFAKILEEARKDAKTNQNSSTIEKESSVDNHSDTSKSEKDRGLSKYAKEKEKLEKDGGDQKQNEGGEKNGEENASAALWLSNQQSNEKLKTEFSTPAARSILHVADLERIVSTIRTENFKHTNQAFISLKNSVLEGLQINISIDTNGKLKATFLALNKQIKKQLEARKKELSEILRSRSLNCSDILILVQE